MSESLKIIAEIGASHNGSFSRCLDLIDAAAKAGADAVKIQTWAPGKMVLDQSYTLRDGQWKGWNLAQMYQEAHTPWDWHASLFKRARRREIELFSSVFDLESLEFLESMECPRYKIASCELVDLPLIRAVAAKKKPIILSTGMATLREIEEAVWATNEAWSLLWRDLTILKCTSDYPARPSSANLATMETLKLKFKCSVGLSDHTPGIGTAIAAAAMGARMIEKHITINQSGLDQAFALTPDQFKSMVELCRVAKESVGGKEEFGPTEGEDSCLKLRRSLYFCQDLPEGGIITEETVRAARPAAGVSPDQLNSIIGMKVKKSVFAGDPVTPSELFA